MTFISVVETFGAVVVALGGLETFKWVKRSFFPSKVEKSQDMVEVAQSVQNLKTSMNEMWKENAKSIQDLDNQRIETLKNSIKTVNEHNAGLIKQIADCQREIARVNDLVSDKTTHIREVEEARLKDTKRYENEITVLTKRNGELEKLVMFYRAWHCEREYGNKKEDCKRRKPAQNPPLRYCPIDEKVVSNTRISSCEDATIINTDNVPELIPENLNTKSHKKK